MVAGRRSLSLFALQYDQLFQNHSTRKTKSRSLQSKGPHAFELSHAIWSNDLQPTFIVCGCSVAVVHPHFQPRISRRWLRTRSRRHGNRTMPFVPLGEEEKSWLAELIWKLRLTARNIGNPMRRVARREISLWMWHWTADGIDPQQQLVGVNAIKYNFELLPHTTHAHLAMEGGHSKLLRHEHCIPRTYFADYLIQHEFGSVAEMQMCLENYCRAVIVTKSEDARLLRDRMPDGWNWQEGHIFARYAHAQHPEGGSVLEHIQCPRGLR